MTGVFMISTHRTVPNRIVPASASPSIASCLPQPVCPQGSEWVGQQINNSPHRYKVTVTNLAKSSGDRGIVLFAPSWAFCFFSVP
jgi:hypothetical protein